MDRQTLCELIQQWNESRFDMFAVTQLDENLEFHGIIRFFYHDNNGKSITKCIRCSSSCNTTKIIDELLVKFRIDNFHASSFCLCETHENGQERILNPDERPLLVQLNWSKDDREGRFVLRQIKKDSQQQLEEEIIQKSNLRRENDFKRGGPKRFSKNERKKRQQHRGMLEANNLEKANEEVKTAAFPYTTFTRTISNPEMIMKRRREQKLESRLRQLGNGGTLKIYGVELFPNRPYVSLLLGMADTAKQIIQMVLEKYGLEGHNPSAYVLVEVFLTEASPTARSYNDLRGVEKRQERCLQENECPLQLLAELLYESANVAFFLRKRPPSFPPTTMPKSITLGDFGPSSQSSSSSMINAQDSRKRHLSADYLMHANEREMAVNKTTKSSMPTINSALLPCLVPINNFASSANFGAAALAIQPGITQIGSSSSCAIQLRAPSVLPRHCCLLYRHEPEGHRVQIMLLDKSALVELNGASIHATMELTDGVQLRIGGVYCYRFFSGVQQQKRPGGQDYQSSSNHSVAINERVGPTRESPLTNPIVASANHPNSSFYHQSTERGGNFFDTSTEDCIYDDIVHPTTSAPVISTPLSTSTPSKEGKKMILLNANNGPPSMGAMGGPGQLLRAMTQPQQFMTISGQSLPFLLECIDQHCENELFQFELFGEKDHYQFVQGGQHFGAFRLIPAFVLYAICRHRLQNCSAELHQQLNRNTFARFIDYCNRTIKANLSIREVLVFWLANDSELLNITRCDTALAQCIGVHLINELAQLVQHIFSLFVESCRQSVFCGVQNALNLNLLANPNNQIQAGSLLSALDECLRSVRWALLNPALTIQLFSQLFHFIGASIFNWLVVSPEARPFITFSFGIRLKQFLQQIQFWAQKQGLELAAECHMDLISQTVNMLTTPKTVEQIATLGATCYKLNSIQVRYLLENYIGDMRNGESPTVGREVVEHVVVLARQQADQQAQKDHGQLQLAESNCLHLPFLIPHDGYVVEKLRGIPPDMAAFVNALQQRGIARVLLQHNGQLPIAEMSWSIFLSPSSSKPRIIAATPILGGTTKESRSNTPVTMFPPTSTGPPNVPPHQQRSATVMSQQKCGSPVVYAEVQRIPNEELQQQQQRYVTPSILPHQENAHPSKSSIPLLKQQWNERMIDAGGQKEVLVQKITIKRTPNEGMGLSIVEVLRFAQFSRPLGVRIFALRFNNRRVNFVDWCDNHILLMFGFKRD